MKFKDLKEGMKLTCMGKEFRVKDKAYHFAVLVRSDDMYDTHIPSDLFDLMEWELVKEKRMVTLAEASADDSVRKLRCDSWGLDFAHSHILKNNSYWCWDSSGVYSPTLADLRGETKFEVVE